MCPWGWGAGRDRIEQGPCCRFLSFPAASGLGRDQGPERRGNFPRATQPGLPAEKETLGWSLSLQEALPVPPTENFPLSRHLSHHCPVGLSYLGFPRTACSGRTALSRSPGLAAGLPSALPQGAAVPSPPVPLTPSSLPSPFSCLPCLSCCPCCPNPRRPSGQGRVLALFTAVPRVPSMWHTEGAQPTGNGYQRPRRKWGPLSAGLRDHTQNAPPSVSFRPHLWPYRVLGETQ